MRSCVDHNPRVHHQTNVIMKIQVWRLSEKFWICLKGLSHCHEFGYDMLGVKNLPQESWRDVAVCRLLLYTVPISRILSGSAYKNFKLFNKILGSTHLLKWVGLFSYWPRNSLVHCRKLSYKLSHTVVYFHHSQTTTESLRVHYG